MNSEILIRPALTGAMCAAADRFAFGDSRLQSNMAFGAAVFSGFLLGELTSVYLIPKNELKGVEQMALEVGISTVGSVAFDRTMFSKDINRVDMLQRVGAIVISDVASTYLRDMWMNRLT